MTKPITSLKEAIDAVEKYHGRAEDFRLAISDSVLDPVGANMAVLLDRILAKGFEPDGYDQMDGYRVYKYKDLE